mgnify:CR=1 FL=1
MIDIEKIRKDPDSVMQALNSRGEELDIRSILEKDQRLRREFLLRTFGQGDDRDTKLRDFNKQTISSG